MKEVGPWHAWKILSNQTGLPSGCQVNISMIKVPVLALMIETSAVWPWYRRSFQDICRGLWIIIAKLTCGLFPMIFRMVFPSCIKYDLDQLMDGENPCLKLVNSARTWKQEKLAFSSLILPLTMVLTLTIFNIIYIAVDSREVRALFYTVIPYLIYQLCTF
jgi:hypothetical protein